MSDIGVALMLILGMDNNIFHLMANNVSHGQDCQDDLETLSKMSTHGTAISHHECIECSYAFIVHFYRIHNFHKEVSITSCKGNK